VAVAASGTNAWADSGTGNTNGGGGSAPDPLTTVAPTLSTTLDGVQFDVVGGNLMVTGDDSANDVTLKQSEGVWKATVGDDSTKLTGVTGSVTITLAGGDDQLVVQQGSIATNLTILMGDGDDTTTLSKLTIGTFLHFEGNSNDDSLKTTKVNVTDPTFAHFSTIDMQDGADRVNLDNFVDQDLQVTLGNGNDSLHLTNSHFLGGPFQRLRIDAGDGVDKLSLEKVATSPLFVDVGPGVRDVLSTFKCTADTATFVDTGGSDGVLHQKKNSFGSISIDPNFL